MRRRSTFSMNRQLPPVQPSSTRMAYDDEFSFHIELR